MHNPFLDLLRTIPVYESKHTEMAISQKLVQLLVLSVEFNSFDICWQKVRVFR